MPETFEIILQNAPQSGENARFIPYGYAWAKMWGGDDEHAPNSPSIINDEISYIKDELYHVHDIAVQLDAVQNGVRGFRIMKVD